MMKAALFYGKEDIRIGSWELPPLKDQDVLVKIKSCGICGSDSRYFFNGPSARYTLPTILGHELSGEVVETGKGLQGYAPGDLVALAPIIPCMRCYPCTHGQDNICEGGQVIGVNIPGAMAEYIHVPSQMVLAGGLVKVPAGISPRSAAQAEIVGCVLHGLRQVGIQPGERILVIGGGPIGMTFVQLGRLHGARMFSSELQENRRALALELGAEAVVDPGAVNLKDHYGPTFDRVIVATASIEATLQSFDLVRTGGSLLLFSGYAKGAVMELVLNDIHYRELHIHGSIDCTIQDYHRAVGLLPQLQMDRLVTSSFPLDETQAAFYATRNPGAIKVMVEP